MRRASLRVAAMLLAFPLLASAAAGAWLARTVFRIHSFAPPWPPLIIAAAIAAIVVAALGLAGTRKVLRTSPLLLLRR